MDRLTSQHSKGPIQRFSAKLTRVVIKTLIIEAPLEYRPWYCKHWKQENKDWKHWRHWGIFPEIATQYKIC